MTKITLLKNRREAETLRLTTIDVVANDIISGQYQEQVGQMRSAYPFLLQSKDDDGSLVGDSKYARELPRICFASAMVNRQKQRKVIGYTGMVLLEVNNLASHEEAVAIRSACRQMPQTLLAFVGASGRSVKIVCKGQLVDDDALPESEEQTERFHVALYEKARMAYNAQIGVSVEKLPPLLNRVCYISADEGAVYNSTAIPFYVDPSLPLAQNVGLPRNAAGEDHDVDTFWNMHHVYEFNLNKAYDQLYNVSHDDDNFLHLLTTALAEQCLQTGVPVGVALHMTEYRLPFRQDKQLVRLVFDNVYRAAGEKKHRGRPAKVNHLKNIPHETLLTIKVRRFLNEYYELRRNVMRGVAEYRERNGLGFDFEDLTAEARNSMTLHAHELGITCWDKDIRRFVESNDIESYDPISDYLERLPRWDGRDRVTALGARIETRYADWSHLFHIWMRSMVAMWQGKGQLTGNALVPLLIGRQGCGKTSFCRILLPRQLREYYNDRINFKNETDLNMGLTKFALINLDEFDSVTQRQQVVLKYLVSTNNLKYRPPYGKAYTAHRRYASFIGTTNELTPLTDPTGSRRFVCVQVENDIDFDTPVDYPQLYAQLCAEIRSGEPYWLTKEEENTLMEHNRQYLQLNGLGEMLLACYRRPNEGEAGTWVSIKDIAARLKQTFGSGFRQDPAALKQIGAFLNRPDYKFDRHRKSSGVEYRVVER